MLGAYWYGGPEQFPQHFPIDSNHTLKRIAYLPGDMVHSPFGGIVEPYWLNSYGAAINADYGQSLFYSWNEDYQESWCLSSMMSEPYFGLLEQPLELRYKMCGDEDPKLMQEYAAANFWNAPFDIPSEKMLTSPIWSTWAQLKTQVNQTLVLKFADEIIENGFTYSHIEIDDKWEANYGDAEFDIKKFPNVTEMVDELHSKGFLVTLWTHPFINADSVKFTNSSNYLVKSLKGKNVEGEFKYLPGLTLWWQGFEAGLIDFHSADAAAWWYDRLFDLLCSTGIDSFKFDAGEGNFLPKRYQRGNYNYAVSPNVYTFNYMHSASDFGNLVEVRTGAGTQWLPIFVRMLDKYSQWGYLNGLKSLIPTLLQMSMVGYPFVLPDMVGGNGYVIPPGRELYIRWMQANVFMPAIQLSYTPWKYDEDVVIHFRDLIALHEEYAPYIIELAKEATNTGILDEYLKL